jgi:chemotaxis protein methyltransferase CheR
MNYIELSNNEFKQFQKLVYEHSGINLHEGKKELLRTRLGKRLRQTGVKTFGEYYDFVTHASDGEELTQMLNAISTNLTSFFRETKHFDFLEREVLSRRLKRPDGAVPQRLKLWSAGCSSGEEPYSLAMCLHGYLGNHTAAKFSIVATDISTRVLSKAKSGIYHRERLKNIPLEKLKTYFQRGHGKWEGYFRLKPLVRNCIEFKRFNLMDAFPFANDFDIIFCRNVLIYFDKMIQQAVVNKFYESLAEGGYLFIGHSESLMSIEHGFKYVNPTVYMKQRA